MSYNTGQSDSQSIEQLTETVMKTAKAMADVCDMIIAKDLKRQRNEPEKIIRYIDDFASIGFMGEMGKLADLVIAANNAHQSIASISSYLRMNPSMDHNKLRTMIGIIKNRINREIRFFKDLDAESISKTRVVTLKNSS